MNADSDPNALTDGGEEKKKKEDDDDLCKKWGPTVLGALVVIYVVYCVYDCKFNPSLSNDTKNGGSL